MERVQPMIEAAAGSAREEGSAAGTAAANRAVGQFRGELKEARVRMEGAVAQVGMTVGDLARRVQLLEDERGGDRARMPGLGDRGGGGAQGGRLRGRGTALRITWRGGKGMGQPAAMGGDKCSFCPECVLFLPRVIFVHYTSFYCILSESMCLPDTTIL